MVVVLLVGAALLTWQVWARGARRESESRAAAALTNRSIALCRAITGLGARISLRQSGPTPVAVRGKTFREFDVECLGEHGEFLAEFQFDIDTGQLIVAGAMDVDRPGREMGRDTAIRATRHWLQVLHMREAGQAEAVPDARHGPQRWQVTWPGRGSKVTVIVNSISGCLILASDYP